MSQVFKTLLNRYRDLVEQSATAGTEPQFLEDVRLFMADTRRAGESVPDPAERSQLRAFMRFLAPFLQDAGQELPPIDLLPLDRERWPTPPQSGTNAVPRWVWVLVGAAALVVIAGLVAVAVSSLGGLVASPTPLPPTPLPTSTATSIPTATPLPPTATPLPTPTATMLPQPPAVSGLTIALGMLSPDEPFLVGNEFDWNTKAVYAVFDYTGMQDGTAWTVVWSRNGSEVAREDHFWDTSRDGSNGTAWAAYFNPQGSVLRGGDYTVALYVQDELQAEAAFHIRYYVPASP